jgi:uncharacterized membrane protein YoaK (UPF0700 family)
LQTPESPPRHFEHILGLTAFAAGAVDVISFTGLGGVFASAMTGNLAFLALYIARGALHSAVGALIALLGFVLGGAIGTLQTQRLDNNRALLILLTTETLLLLAAMIVWLLSAHVNGAFWTEILILLLATSMGLQSIVAKKINLSNIPAVVFTSTLTNIVMALTDLLASGKFIPTADTKRQMASFLLYFSGALMAGLLVYLQVSAVILLPYGAVVWALIRHRRANR